MTKKTNSKRPRQSFNQSNGDSLNRASLGNPATAREQKNESSASYPAARSEEETRELLRRIAKRLRDDPEIDTSQFTVALEEGVVTIRGRVADKYLRDRIADRVREVDPAMDLNNFLNTRETEASNCGDLMSR